MCYLIDFLKDERAATAVEYGIIASMIGMAGLVAFSALGQEVVAIFEGVTDSMRQALS